MRSPILALAALLAAMPGVFPAGEVEAAPRKPGTARPGASVRWATGFERAVTEACALNLPLVIHRHGFYWSPCKEVHRAVLTNRTYIAFAEKSTVEVICMQDLDRALAEKDPQVRTYRAKDRYGDDVEYLVRFPGLTVEALRDLAESRALQYMEGSLMPATVILDPHTLEKIGGIARAVRRADEFVKAIRPHVDALKKKYGAGVSRKLWREVDEATVKIDTLLGAGKVVEALAACRGLEKETARQPDVIARRVRICFETALEDAARALDALEKRLAEPDEGRDASRELARLAAALADTPLAGRAQALGSSGDKDTE